jgi:general stress protein 26
MKQEAVSYKELEQDFIEELKKLGNEGLYQRGILATAANDFVTARRMRFIPDGLTLYCWTSTNSRKHKQLLVNPKVAVVLGFIQIEGVAEILKHPLEEPEFLELYKERMPNAYEDSIKDWDEFDQFLIKITPKRVAEYKLPDVDAGRSVAGMDLLNVETGEAYRLTEWKRIQKDEESIRGYYK